MSVRKLTASLLAILVMLGGITTANAWDHDPVVADPFQFEPDFQWFQPVTNLDLADLKPKKRAHYGWFATYDRLNLHASRPDTDDPQKIDTKLDSGWGHRYAIGFMTPDKDTGWLFNWTGNGVGVEDAIGPTVLQEFFVLNEAYPIAGLPNWTGKISVNVVNYDSYELNKTWRMEPYHYGGILEPMIGARWMRIRDSNRFEDYRFPIIPPDPANDVGDVNSEVAITDNDMLGGQLGFRYTKFRDRFTFSSDFRVFAGGSWQCTYYQEKLRDLTLDPFVGPNGAFLQVVPRTAARGPAIRSRNEESFVGFDLRTELAYQISRYFTIRGGVQLIDVATGVWRGGDGEGSLDPGDQNQDLLLLGGTFGITLNR